MYSIINILKQHNITYRLQGHLLFTENVYTINGTAHSYYILVSYWTYSKLMQWLGY
jgi:hypothetical protein